MAHRMCQNLFIRKLYSCVHMSPMKGNQKHKEEIATFVVDIWQPDCHLGSLVFFFFFTVSLAFCPSSCLFEMRFRKKRVALIISLISRDFIQMLVIALKSNQCYHSISKYHITFEITLRILVRCFHKTNHKIQNSHKNQCDAMSVQMTSKWIFKSSFQFIINLVSKLNMSANHHVHNMKQTGVISR